MMASSKSIPKLVELIKSSRPIVHKSANFKPKLMEHICQKHKLVSFPTEKPKSISHVGGDRSYMLVGSLAKLERALMKWTMNELVAKYNFIPVVVPNILHDDIIERCGFPTKSERSQVYKISGNNVDSILDENDHKRISNPDTTHSCIAGTSEFALVSTHIGDTISSEELPKKYCALSTCYRAETSSTSSEWGLYRAHYFKKVEMVALTMPDGSHDMQEYFLNIEKDLFNQLNLEYKVLDMPEDDLGLSASRKYDIEAWMPGRSRFGELSSTSNCEDYQSSRLNIQYQKIGENNGQLKVDSGFVHTINGTACSSLRTLIALIEQHQTEDDEIMIPEPLVPYMDGVYKLPLEDDTYLLKNIDLYPDEY